MFEISRRKMLGGSLAVGLTSALAGVKGAGLEPQPFLNADSNMSDRWEWVRRMFSFPDGLVPMNAANLCPAFSGVTNAVCTKLDDMDKDVSFQNRTDYADDIEKAREAVAKALRVGADDICFVRNTSEANNVLNSGLKIHGGQRVLVWDENHPTNREAWEIRARKEHFHIDCVTVDPSWDSKKMTEAFIGRIQKGTRVLTFTQVSNVTGIRLDANELCRRAREQAAKVGADLFIHVDGAQSWGAFDLNLKEMDCDSFSASSHKWFMGPRETGILYMRPEKVEELEPLIFGYDTYIKVPCPNTPICPEVCDLPNSARRFELLGQRSDASLMAIAATQQYLNQIGQKNIETRIAGLVDKLILGLQRINGVKLTTPVNKANRHGVVVFELPEGRDNEKLFQYMYRRRPVAVIGAKAGKNGFRLCPHVYNLDSHIEAAYNGVAEFLRMGTTP